MISIRQEQARRKLLRLLDRSTLEDLSGHSEPRRAYRRTLEIDVFARWPWDEIHEAVMRVVEEAR